jgi:hypothetical protein
MTKEIPIKTSLRNVPSETNQEEIYQLGKRAYLSGHYFFSKEQVSKMGNHERMVLEILGLREYGKR